MIRTQVQLDPKQASALRRLAVERGLSIAALIREAVARLLEDQGREERVRRALAAAGRGSSGLGDVSVRHDDYVAEDFLD